MSAQPAGSDVIRARAIERVLAAVSADALGVPASRTRVSLRAREGAIAVSVTSAASSGAGGVLGLVAAARDALATRGVALTGATLADVEITIDDIIEPARRLA